MASSAMALPAMPPSALALSWKVSTGILWSEMSWLSPALLAERVLSEASPSGNLPPVTESPLHRPWIPLWLCPARWALLLVARLVRSLSSPRVDPDWIQRRLPVSAGSAKIPCCPIPTLSAAAGPWEHSLPLGHAHLPSPHHLSHPGDLPACRARCSSKCVAGFHYRREESDSWRVEQFVSRTLWTELEQTPTPDPGWYSILAAHFVRYGWNRVVWLGLQWALPPDHLLDQAVPLGPGRPHSTVLHELRRRPRNVKSQRDWSMVREMVRYAGCHRSGQIGRLGNGPGS
jgi:hypothetical protein